MSCCSTRFFARKSLSSARSSACTIACTVYENAQISAQQDLWKLVASSLGIRPLVGIDDSEGDARAVPSRRYGNGNEVRRIGTDLSVTYGYIPRVVTCNLLGQLGWNMVISH